MGVPALLVDFPRPSASNAEEYIVTARKLGRQWSVFWRMGNAFFRPLSTLGIVCYGYAAYATLRAASLALLRDSQAAQVESIRWKFYALSATCHLVTVLHSALRIQPINKKIVNLERAGMQGQAGEVRPELAEFWARKWVRLNTLRILMPAIAGSLAIFGVMIGR